MRRLYFELIFLKYEFQLTSKKKVYSFLCLLSISVALFSALSLSHVNWRWWWWGVLSFNNNTHNFSLITGWERYGKTNGLNSNCFNHWKFTNFDLYGLYEKVWALLELFLQYILLSLCWYVHAFSSSSFIGIWKYVLLRIYLWIMYLGSLHGMICPFFLGWSLNVFSFCAFYLFFFINLPYFIL